jgi:hypothetical protein
MHWWNAIWRLRPAFSRLQTFLWFATAVAGFTVRTDMLGVTSIVRALNLDARCYNTLIDCFHSSAVKLDQLTALWTQVVLRLFPQPLRVNGRCVLVGDGIKVPKCGRKPILGRLLGRAMSDPVHHTVHQRGKQEPAKRRLSSGSHASPARNWPRHGMLL